MTIAEEYKALVEVVEWIDEYFISGRLAADQRSLFAQGCFEIAIDNQAAIAVLYASQLHGSIFTLLSGLTLALMRGLWLIHCADDTDISRYKSHQIDKSFSELIGEVESSMGRAPNALLGLKAHAWRAMNSVARAAIDPNIWRCSKHALDTQHSEGEIAQALILSAVLGLVAAGQLAGLSGRDDLVELAIQRMQDFANRANGKVG